MDLHGLRIGVVEFATPGSKRQQQSIFPKASQRDSVRMGLEQKMTISVIFPILSKGDGLPDHIGALCSQAVWSVEKCQESIPCRLLQNEPQRPLAEYPGLCLETVGGFSLDLVADILDDGTYLLLEDIKVGFADKSRVPNMNDTVDCLVNVVDSMGDQEQDYVAGHNIQISVIDCHLDGLVVAVGKLSNGFDNVSEVPGSCT